MEETTAVRTWNPTTYILWKYWLLNTGKFKIHYNRNNHAELRHLPVWIMATTVKPKAYKYPLQAGSSGSDTNPISSLNVPENYFFKFHQWTEFNWTYSRSCGLTNISRSLTSFCKAPTIKSDPNALHKGAKMDMGLGLPWLGFAFSFVGACAFLQTNRYVRCFSFKRPVTWLTGLVCANPFQIACQNEERPT